MSGQSVPKSAKYHQVVHSMVIYKGPNERLASYKGRVTGFSAYLCETQVMIKVINVSSEENSSYCTTSTQLGCWANYLRFASSPAGYDVWKSGLSAKKLDWIYFCCTFNLCNLSENDLFIPEKFQVHPCPWNSLTLNIWQTQLWSARSKLNMWQRIIWPKNDSKKYFLNSSMRTFFVSFLLLNLYFWWKTLFSMR